MILNRYKKNLKVVGDNVLSYNTHVATIDHYKNKVYMHGYWSVTTQKHINHVVRKLGYELEKRSI